MKRRNFLKAGVSGGLLLASGAGTAQATPAGGLAPEAVGILYDATLCIGCKSCMVNCKKYNAMPGGALEQKDGSIPYEFRTAERIHDAPVDLSAKTLNIIKAYKAGSGVNKDREENGYSFVKMHCMHCLEPACVSVCPVGALRKDAKNGVVGYDADRCIGCRYCQMACPFGIPKFEWTRALPQIRKCQLCNHRYKDGGYSACCEFCPTGASLFGRVSDLRCEATRRLELAPGDMYDYPLGRVDGPARMSKAVAVYNRHVYGLSEAGGTQYLLLAGVSFKHLGFNPAISGMAAPAITWSYISKLPWLIAGLLAVGAVCHLTTKKNKSGGPVA